MLLWAELQGSRLGIWLAKPLASSRFIVTALLAGAVDSSYGQLILLGLCLSWLGDVFLIPKPRVYFIVGLGSFLLAHLAYVGAFLLQPLSVSPLALSAMAMLVVAVFVLRWLWLNLTPGLRPAVVAYLLAISLMVALAGGTIVATGLHVVIAAVMFAVSDIFVAREKFVSPNVANRFWGLPLYYGAQTIFALSTQAHFS